MTASTAAAREDRTPDWGTVVATTPAGPILSGRRAPAVKTRRGTFIPTLSKPDRAVVAGLTIVWVLAFVGFWVWWLQPDHRVGWAGLILNSALLFYLSYLPSYFLVVVNRLHRVNPELAVPALRTAFVVTKAPSEPWEVASKTLEAMLGQRFPHPYDVWLCDEDPSDEVLAWCAQHGVDVSSRHGVAEYHQKQWPRRTRCKEGNLAYFYDKQGYRDYDVIAQLDCDHVPAPTYLSEMVRPFADPAIGYVAAPSVNDSNATASWSARGRLHREATFHGPVQLGHSDGLAPSCIGSHYAVRTQALKTIGGIGPELAEDFSTAFLLTSAGWKSAFAHTAEAHGEGPHTFAAMATQEFQWSRSLVMLFFDMVPKHLLRLSWPLRVRFLFALSYYPLLTVTTIAGLAMPVLAAVSGAAWINVNYFEFILRWMALNACMLAITLFIRRRGLLRPQNAPIISWENWMYAFARWPFIGWGVLAAVMQKIRPQPLTFRVTPKTTGGLEPLPTRLVLPFGATSAVLAGAALIGEASTGAFGYVFLCILGATCYGIVTLAVPLLHAREAARNASASFASALRGTVVTPLVLAASAWVLVIASASAYPAYLSRFLH
ncbi:glycosyltransferase [Arthrobacter sp. PAMC25564]|uniref:glycosyltransferase family 2 protein n=1 Tax=Arthrobacter sp. PAMC25564 TaxID=2565366 RepID=UPI0010A23246|nr:glycosyltransferase family 2 protein [Arthrobacter sp. PAMC25564]QCB97860.1 glycosyltransferase [Arthrobacter sp. PAMC25564]